MVEIGNEPMRDYQNQDDPIVHALGPDAAKRIGRRKRLLIREAQNWLSKQSVQKRLRALRRKEERSNRQFYSLTRRFSPYVARRMKYLNPSEPLEIPGELMVKREEKKTERTKLIWALRLIWSDLTPIAKLIVIRILRHPGITNWEIAENLKMRPGNVRLIRHRFEQKLKKLHE